MNKCKYCGKNISEEDQIIKCPDCMTNFHLNCVNQRIINTETTMGIKKTYKTYYYNCPICGKIVNKENQKLNTNYKLILNTRNTRN